MNKTTSLALSKGMKTLGVKQESEKYWEKEVGNDFKWHLVTGNIDWEPSQMDNMNVFSAFDPSELGEMLPVGCITKKVVVYKNCKPTKKHAYQCWRGHNFTESFEAETMAEAMGEMWCYLKENKLI